MNENQLIPNTSALEPGHSAGFASLSPEPVTIDIQGPGLKRDYAGLLEYWQMIRRHKGAVVFATCVGAIGGFVLTLSEPRIYQARTTLEIQGLNPAFLNLNMKNVNPIEAGGGGDVDSDIQTQVRILQSKVLLTRVRDKLSAQPRPENLQPPDRLGVWRKALRVNPPNADQLWTQALGTAFVGVRVRSSMTNRIVEVSCDSTSGQTAASFCNTLTKEYIDDNLEARWKTTEYTGQWLTKQLQDLKVKLEKQEEELQAYARATNLVFAGQKSDVDGQETRLADLQKELSAAQTDRISKQSKYEMAASGPADALPDVLDDPTLKASQASLAELYAKLAQLKVTFTPNAPEVKRVQAQIDAIEASLEGSRSKVLVRIGRDYEATKRREALLASAYKEQARLVSGQSEQTAHYSLLRRDVDATRLLYETLLQRLKEASIASALRANNIRVVDAAERPSVPYKPDVPQRATYGLILGMIAGIAFAVVRERADRTLQDPGDVAYYLAVPELGVVPTFDLLEASRFKKKVLPNVAADESSASPGNAGVEMISWGQRSSVVAESFRTTLTSILFSRQNGDRPQVLVLTSASPKEGKTTVVSNLSIALAQINQTVLLIDADMRRPRLHSVFDVENGRGLSDLLVEKAPLELAELMAACTETAVPGLQLMTSGTSRAHASSLVHSPRLAEIIALARGKFDTIVIDTPPMINIADARIIGRLSDALILVVRSGTTTRDAALIAKARFAGDGTPVLGTILNFWNPKTPGYSYYKYHEAGYYYYGSRGNGDAGGNGDGNGDGGGQPGVKERKVRDVQPPTEQLVVSPVSMRAARSAAMERWLQENAKT
ncbi:MAG: polysaccharide biosynthesis tyrosine autokinase [Acidobacteriota bacterium]